MYVYIYIYIHLYIYIYIYIYTHIRILHACDAFITLVENPLARGLPSKVGGHSVNKPLACSRRFINTRPPTLLDRPLARGFSTNVVKPLQVKNIKEPSCLQVVIEHPATE